MGTRDSHQLEPEHDPTGSAAPSTNAPGRPARLPRVTLSVAALTAANLAPLAGALLLGWDAAAILLVYWSENLIIGFYNVLKMALVRAEPPLSHLGKLFAIPFFCIHFGGFCAVHGFFLLVLLKVGGDAGQIFPRGHGAGPLVFLQLLGSVVATLWRSGPRGIEWPILGLFVSHGISFVQNYLLGGEYRSLTVRKLMGQPYSRIVVLHIAIIAGGMPVMMLGSPVYLLAVLVALKIGMDIWLHVKSHRTAPAGADAHLMQPRTFDRGRAGSKN